MGNKNDLTQFEFLLRLEGNIICQRYFNVQNHKNELKHSMEIYDYMTDIAKDICDELKTKTFLYLTDKDRPYNFSDEEVGSESYKLELRIDNRTFFVRAFPANVYHPKVRYAVDIRPKLKGYLTDLTNLLSTSKVKKEYLNYQLK